MDILQLAKDALAVIQQAEPGLAAAVKVGADLGTLGTTVVRVIQKGQQLVSYLITRKGPPAAQPRPAAGLEPVKRGEPVAKKADVAVLVDINRRMLQDVARYLDQQKIDADLVVVTNDPVYSPQVKFLDHNDPDAWANLVREFNVAINEIKHAVGGARLHIFLSTPLPLAFGLGAVWGTVDEATIYHWEGQTYCPVMKISRTLRSAPDPDK